MIQPHARILIVVALAAVLAAAGCNFVSDAEEPVTSAPDDSSSAVGGPIVLNEVIILDEGETVEGRPADDVTVNEVGLQGDSLSLNVSWGGGCKEHEFELYARGSFDETSPPNATVWLSHDGNSDACDAWATTELLVDLAPLQQVFEQKHPEGEAFEITIYGPTGGEFERVEADALLYEL